jgi:endonuclease/exonuclease/phosphatase family metal-dependent hydrolase
VTPAEHTLRVVSFNTLWGVDLERDAAFFTSDPDLAGADVIALQEVSRGPGEAKSDAGQLASRLQMGYVFVPTFEEDGGLYGVALLSRFPIHDIQVMLLPEPQLDIVDPAARAALRARIDTEAGPITVINVHLDVALSIPERILQLRPAVIDSPAPVVVLGDFNTNDYVWALDSIPVLPLDAVASTSQATALDDYMRVLGFATPTAELGETWHGFPEDQRLDSIFTRGLATGDGAVERELDTSDHWPIWLDVTAGP